MKKWEDCTDVLSSWERLSKGLKQEIQLADLRLPFSCHSRNPLRGSKAITILIAPECFQVGSDVATLMDPRQGQSDDPTPHGLFRTFPSFHPYYPAPFPAFIIS